MTRKVYQVISCDVEDCDRLYRQLGGTFAQAVRAAMAADWTITDDDDRCPDHPFNLTHWGNGVGGIGLAKHKGIKANCPAPECGR